MAKYVAFLRAINVGGHNLIKMQDLVKLFTSLEFENTVTYLQSGNVIFETNEKNSKEISEKIEKKIIDILKKEVKVFIRTESELNKLVESKQFKQNIANSHAYVIFIEDKPSTIPLKSPKEDVEIIAIENNNIISLSHLVNGKYGSPGNYLETKLKILTTTRNCNSLNGLMKILKNK
ncbi:Uncharacterised protein [uncultured archaeon]|nr:Uncharacterised protein [uncultured archaeon]